jgi:cyclopropane-fatty-acyl-phospholipid synthase
MFEHMTNWRELMTRVGAWLKPEGRFFLHIFTHRSGAYLFDRADGEDWIAQRFLTGGVMPSHHLIRQYADLFEVEKEWRWSGEHYQRTAQHWLANFDPCAATRSSSVLSQGLWRGHRAVDAALALVLLATSGLFGYADGSEWGVSHYRLKASLVRPCLN